MCDLFWFTSGILSEPKVGYIIFRSATSVLFVVSDNLPGHYLYVDGTSSLINTYAKLISPMYKKSARGCRFNMWYFMFGVEYGDLEVRLVTQGGLDYRLIKVSDDIFDYNKWILSESIIPTCTRDFQVGIYCIWNSFAYSSSASCSDISSLFCINPSIGTQYLCSIPMQYRIVDGF